MLGGAITRRVIFAKAVWGDGVVESDRVSATVLVPGAVGVPVICPPALIVKPDGRPVARQWYGETPPAPWIVELYGCPTTPSGSDVVVISGGTFTVTVAIASAMKGVRAVIVVVPGPTAVIRMLSDVGLLPSQMKLTSWGAVATPGLLEMNVTGIGTIAGPESTSNSCPVPVLMFIEAGLNA